jgi:hypothetical protein
MNNNNNNKLQNGNHNHDDNNNNDDPLDDHDMMDDNALNPTGLEESVSTTLLKLAKRSKASLLEDYEESPMEARL